MILDEGESLRNQLLEHKNDDWFYFFALFARFEYAMKRGGFRRCDHAEAAWRKFLSVLDPCFWEQCQCCDAAKILFVKPPKRLNKSADGDGVSWETDPKPPETVQDLLERVKTVRNNLFHGDKTEDFNGEADDGGIRNRKLVLAATAVLEIAWQCTSGNPEFSAFRQSFLGNPGPHGA